jgi:hypothetical protein
MTQWVKFVVVNVLFFSFMKDDKEWFYGSIISDFSSIEEYKREQY